VHASTFGDRLVAKFGLPVRGFREARRSGPGHELFTSRNVLTSDVVVAGADPGEDPTRVSGEVDGAGTHAHDRP
jgi:NAD+ kinase